MFCVKMRNNETERNINLSAEEKSAGQIAVEVATKGETENIGRPKYGFKWNDFGKFVGIWLIIAIVLLGALVFVTIVRGSSNVFRDTIKEVDTLNMMFSLVLSALLEQIWSKPTNSGNLYNVTLGVEGVLTILGGMLFMAYSIVKITDPTNQLLQYSFNLNIVYIIASTVVVLLGFLSRTRYEKI